MMISAHFSSQRVSILTWNIWRVPIIYYFIPFIRFINTRYFTGSSFESLCRTSPGEFFFTRAIRAKLAGPSKRLAETDPDCREPSMQYTRGFVNFVTARLHCANANQIVQVSVVAHLRESSLKPPSRIAERNWKPRQLFIKCIAAPYVHYMLFEWGLPCISVCKLVVSNRDTNGWKIHEVFALRTLRLKL